MVYAWDEDVFYLRCLLYDSMSKLYDEQPETNYKIVIKEKLTEKAMNCHLRPQKKAKHIKCPLCSCNDDLKRYEAKLFNMVRRKKAFEEMSLVGSWKPTQEEIIMRCKDIFSILSDHFVYLFF